MTSALELSYLHHDTTALHDLYDDSDALVHCQAAGPPRGDRREHDDSGRPHGLHERKRRERQRYDVEAPAAGLLAPGAAARMLRNFECCSRGYKKGAACAHSCC